MMLPGAVVSLGRAPGKALDETNVVLDAGVFEPDLGSPQDVAASNTKVALKNVAKGF